ncbi:hypothetical protein E3N88_24610 [Mikania micrantha]|uniref:Uncharacterized protein n=1 Tax=Mikania micrantha TaxID=192012 RepID=A0A5N6N3C0_9ASTR|nr:hypothetical protein E3N88_24610 [Mikania micrantha]
MAKLCSASFHRLTCSIPLVPSTASALAKCTSGSSRSNVYFTPFVLQNPIIQSEIVQHEEEEEQQMEMVDGGETESVLYSISPLPLLLLAALPGAGTIRSLFGPFVELVKSWDLPDWLVHWGHPGNMAVVLFAMGGYGTYLGFRIRFSDDVEEKAMAKDLHPKLLAGMFFFFALGATGGSGIMTLFLVHAALGLQLGLSY